MSNDKKDKGNFIDYFLDNYESVPEEYERIYEKPKKSKTIIGFIGSIVFLIALIPFASLSGLFFILLIGDILAIAFYGINLFTEKGIKLPKTVRVVHSNEEETTEEVASEETISDLEKLGNKDNEDKYKVQ